MKLKDDPKSKMQLNFQSNKILKPSKILYLKYKQDSSGLDNKINSTTKNILNSENKQISKDEVKSSIFHKNFRSKGKSLNFTHVENKNYNHNNLVKINSLETKEKTSEANLNKIKAVKVNFSNSISSKNNLPEIKNEIFPNFNLTTKNKTALHFFRPTKKKSVISLKKDLNNEQINIHIPLKKPKKPSTMENWKSFTSKNSNLNNQNNLNMNNFNKINKDKDNFFEEHNVNKSYVILSEENKADNYISKININLNTYLLNNQNNENNNFKNINNYNNLNLNDIQKNTTHFKKPIVSGNKQYFNADNISTYNCKDSSAKFENEFNSKQKYLSTNKYNNNNYNKSNLKLNLKNKAFDDKTKPEPSDFGKFELCFDKTNSIASPYSLGKNYTTLNSDNLNSFGVVLNCIDNYESRENILNAASNTNKNLNVISKNNIDFNSYFQTIENIHFTNFHNKELNSITKENSPVGKMYSKCLSPASPANTHNISNYKIKKNKSMQNFFNVKALSESTNNNNNDNNNIFKSLFNQSNTNKVSKNFLSAYESKKYINRPRTVNGISNFKFNAKINQETYNSIQDILVTPTSYLPFSRKRDNLLELEKQSFIFQDKVDKELKIAKIREAKKIKIKSKNELSNYLMRDYFIGEKSNHVEGSK